MRMKEYGIKKSATWFNASRMRVQYGRIALVVLVVFATTMLVIACEGAGQNPADNNGVNNDNNNNNNNNTLSIGGSCAADNQCSDALICAGISGQAVCSDKSSGSACVGNSQCDGSLYCDTTTTDGDAVSNVCVVRKSAGATCGSANHCASGLVCANTCTAAELGVAVRIGSATNFGAINETSPSGLAAIGDTLYLVGQGTDALYTLDTATGVAIRVGDGSISQFGVSENAVGGIAAIADALYMVGSTTDALYTLDTASGAAVRIGSEANFGISDSDVRDIRPISLVAVGDALYMGVRITVGSVIVGRLYRFDTDDSGNLTGTATRVGVEDDFGVGESIPNGLAVIGNTLYMAGNSGDVLYSIDTASGVATRIGSETLVRFDISENTPAGLAAIDNTLYMIGAGGDALYAVRYE